MQETLIGKIKADQLTARKNRKNDLIPLLTTLIGEAEAIGKNNGNRESTDIEVVTIIKKFIKANNDNIELITDPESVITVHAIRDNAVLQQYLPPQLTDDNIKAFVLRIITNEQHIDMSNMGIIMKKLNAQYPGQVNGKIAASIVRATIKENI